MAPNEKAPDIYSKEKVKINAALSAKEVNEAPETTVVRAIDDLRKEARVKLTVIHEKYIGNKIYEAEGSEKIPFLRDRYEQDRKKSISESEKAVKEFSKNLDALFDQPKIAEALSKMTSAKKAFNHQVYLEYVTGFAGATKDAINIHDGAPINQDYNYTIKKEVHDLRPTVLIKPSTSVG